jgi:hypothetical protein
MSNRPSVSPFATVALAVLALLMGSSPLAFGQHRSQGSVVVTVLDQTGALVQGAQLELRDAATN